MKRIILIAAITVVLASVFANTVFALPEEVIISDVKIMSHTDWSPDGRFITFSSKGDIFIVEIDSGVVKNVTENYDFYCYYPIYSHDGTEIFFSQYHLLQTESMPNTLEEISMSTQALNLETGEIRLLIDGAYLANISHDGRYAIYTKDFKYRAIFDFKTNEEKIFDITDATEPPFFEVSTSDISPDNSYLITTYLNFTRIPTWLEFNDKFGLYKVDIASGVSKEIEIDGLSYTNPEFSPDGSNLLLTQRDAYEKEIPINEDTVWYKKDGTPINVVEMYQSDDTNAWIKDPETGEFSHPTMENFWNIPGEQDIYMRNQDGVFELRGPVIPKTQNVPGFTYKVVIYDFKNKQITKVVDSGILNSFQASWSPDGTRICYIMADADKICSLYTYDLELGVHKLVVHGNTYELEQTAVAKTDEPTPFALTGNYPNPFNPSTTIEYTLEKSGDVSIDIFNVAGQKIRELVSAQMNPGTHSILWDGRNENGVIVSSGVYICRLKMGHQVQAKQMILAK